MTTEDLIPWFRTVGLAYGLKVLGSVAILFIGRWIGRVLTRLLRRVLTANKTDPIVTDFVVNLAGAAMLALVLVGAIQNLGVPTASFVALIGAAGLAIGLALQGSLSNFAAGILMILLRPFTKGDYIEGGGTAGTVDEITVFHTRLRTPDNRVVIVPNGKLSNDIIVNYSAMTTRRLDLVFRVSHSDNLETVRNLLREVAGRDSRILTEPAPEIRVDELTDNSVNFIFRVWVNTAQFWPVRFDTIESVKNAFDQNGIITPIPQRNVHIASGDVRTDQSAAV